MNKVVVKLYVKLLTQKSLKRPKTVMGGTQEGPAKKKKIQSGIMSLNSVKDEKIF